MSAPTRTIIGPREIQLSEKESAQVDDHVAVIAASLDDTFVHEAHSLKLSDLKGIDARAHAAITHEINITLRRYMETALKGGGIATRDTRQLAKAFNDSAPVKEALGRSSVMPAVEMLNGKMLDLSLKTVNDIASHSTRLIQRGSCEPLTRTGNPGVDAFSNVVRYIDPASNLSGRKI